MTNLPLTRLAFLLMAVATAPVQAQSPSESVLHSFAPGPPHGSSPYAGLIRDDAGNLYGTTSGGGAWGFGTVYKVDQVGHQTVLYSFTGGADGSQPGAGVILDAAGNLYGNTTYGGAAPNLNGSGVVYKLDAGGHQTVLYTFTGGPYSANPSASLVLDPTGNIYGTTPLGGAYKGGTFFKLDTALHHTVLHSFTGKADGSGPNGVFLDSAGNFFGTTYSGGKSGAGVIFKMDTAGHETLLYSFTGGSDGGGPQSGVVRDAAGNLYGVAGHGTAGYGVVFKLDTAGRESVLYTFSGGADGRDPIGLVADSAGNLYGTTYEGGLSGCYSTCGVVYKVDSAGRETVLYSFTGLGGGNPIAGVILDSAGNLYGTTQFGGNSGAVGDGVVYKLDTAGLETMLYSFPRGVDGAGPQAAVVRDPAGNLYGTTFKGGIADFGVVYQLDAAGHETLLHTFTGGADGRLPAAALIRDSAGNLYGTARGGGAGGAGVVFKLDTALNFTVLYSFTGGADGGGPWASLTRDSSGNLYGTTQSGGVGNAGVVFKLSAAGLETVLHSFTGGADGAKPIAGVILDSAGNLYGATPFGGIAGSSGHGIVYKLDQAGDLTVLYRFTGGADGGDPNAGVIRDSAGNLYGTTIHGGTAAAGVVYMVDQSGQEMVLHDFTGGADGSAPYAGVVRDSAGNLYGTTYRGGAGDAGVVFKLDVAGRETILYAFTGLADGANPQAGVIFDPAGGFYGTASSGGQQSAGVIFKLAP